MPLLDIFSVSKKRKGAREEEKIEIVVDNRERNSLVASELVRLGFNVRFEQLAVGDYLVGDAAIERKTISDFKSSIVDKRIISQLLELQQFPRRLLILEGFNENVYFGGVHENAFRGFLLSVCFEFNVPVVFTLDSNDSAKYISVLAKKKEKKDYSIRGSKIVLSDEEQVQFILEGFPNVGPTKAKALIEKFGSLHAVFGASEEELSEILGKRAGEFRRLMWWKKG